MGGAHSEQVDWLDYVDWMTRKGLVGFPLQLGNGQGHSPPSCTRLPGLRGSRLALRHPAKAKANSRMGKRVRGRQCV